MHGDLRSNTLSNVVTLHSTFMSNIPKMLSMLSDVSEMTFTNNYQKSLVLSCSEVPGLGPATDFFLIHVDWSHRMCTFRPTCDQGGDIRPLAIGTSYGH